MPLELDAFHPLTGLSGKDGRNIIHITAVAVAVLESVIMNQSMKQQAMISLSLNLMTWQ
jgi:hypothetical protein